MRLRLAPRDSAIDFMAKARVATIASLVLWLVSLAAIPFVGLNLGIDFRGGTMILAETDGPPDIAGLRAALGGIGAGEVAITSIADPAAAVTGAQSSGVMIRIGQPDGVEQAQSEVVTAATAAMLAVDPTARVLGVETVGGKVSGELLTAGALALGLAIAAILVYIWLRFEWQFAVGAVVALVHDVVLTIGFFILLRLEFNLSILAALLTIIGYGINDTVVVFDRLRENLRKYKTMPLRELLNLSLNQTLARTLVTSVTTFLAVFAMFALGGEVIRGFTIAMLWGVFVGTYSTIFVAVWVVERLGVQREPLDADAAAGVKFGAADAP